jgi:A/G-specific adenine glycosylase
MLQQTQVDRVLPKYREFVRKYPSIEALAAASVDAVRETWVPLGYNIRPVRLHAIARTVVRDFNGRVPDDRTTLLGLKGIGPYTAGAVLSFAYGRRVPLVDTNVRRLLQRVFYGVGPAVTGARDRALWQLASALLPRGTAYDFNQGMMELGATVCVARTPRCGICPVRAICRAYPHFVREAAASSREAARRTSRRGRGG